MDLKKLISLDEKMQIISAIKKASPFGGDIWQSHTLGRHIFPIMQIYSDGPQDKISFKSFSINELNKSTAIFIRLYYRNLIFRLNPSDYQIMDDIIICDYPKSARALEIRNYQRYILPFDSNTSISIKRMVRSVRDLGRDLEVRILDVSEKGFGLIISGLNRDYLQLKDHLWIKSVDQMKLQTQIFGEVTYIAPKGYYLKRGEVRVGLKLERALSFDLFDHLKRKCHLVLSA